jgi:hypothetical protein
MANWVTAIASVIAALASVFAVFKIQNVHLSLNSRLSQWKAETDSRISSAYAQGKQDQQNSTKNNS